MGLVKPKITFQVGTEQVGIHSNGTIVEHLNVIPATQDHRSFILSTWIRSYEPYIRRLIVAGMSVRGEDYRNGESRAAERHWESSRVVTGDDGYTVHGWVCGHPGTLFHVYVAPQLRGGGLGKGLVEVVSGKDYVVTKPWPKVPHGHTVHYNPWGIL